MAQGKFTASGAKLGQGTNCKVCGVSSHQKTLVGLRNDRRKDGPRFCLPHHPDSFVGAGALEMLERVS
jgi:hypothetical protein